MIDAMDYKTATVAELERNRWEFYKDGADEWRWRCRDENTKKLFNCSEGYSSLEAAKQCARRAGWDERKTTTGLEP